MASSVCVISRQHRFPVEAPSSRTDPTIVPAESLTFEITGSHLPTTVLLDGRPAPLILDAARSRGHLFLDAFRSVGFHHLSILGDDFFFATDDAKLRLDGILSLLRCLQHLGLSWGRQLFFSDGSVVRDAKVDFAWLLQNAARIGQLARSISERPVRRNERSGIWGPPRGGRVLVQPTVAALRRHQKVFLEEHASGHLRIAGRTYSPGAAVTLRSRITADTTSNRRMTRLILDTIAMARSVLASDLPSDAKAQLTPLATALLDASELFPFSRLHDKSVNVSLQASPEEFADERYAHGYKLLVDLADGLGWQPSTTVADRYAYVAYSDQLYQAFVAVMLADAAKTVQTTHSLRPHLDSPSFASDQFSLFYDTVPPKTRFQNWRDLSSRPSDMRPDITVVDHVNDKGLLVDAKYRRDGTRVDSRSINECQVYLHSFRRSRIVVCYPGTGPAMNSVAGDGSEILEVSIGPFDGVREYVRDTVWPAIVSRLESNRPLTTPTA